MPIDSSMIISGLVSKVVNDGVDVLKKKIKDADKNRKVYEQNIETRIYQVTIDALKEFTKDENRGEDALYDAAESIIQGFKNWNDDYIEAVRAGFKKLELQVTGDTCEAFLGTLCHVICKDENDVLYKEITMLQHGKIIEGVHEGFKQSHQNEEQALEKLDYVIDKLDEKDVQNKEGYSEIYPENRAEEYAQKWDKNVFLNNFKKRDKKKGENVKLREIYLEYHLPHYVWKAGDEPLNDLRDLLSEYIVDRDDKKMLLILGQPGIGKSTLITWIMANLVDKKDDIFVYQFATDLENVDWQGDDILNDIFKALCLKDDDLQNKILILDGFDEIHASKDRKSILNQLYQKLRGKIKLKNFSLVVTCREKYIYELPKIECDYITLQAWDDMQIKSFCKTYEEVSKSNISQDKIDKILENKKIFGIPLILYMVLALCISIEKNSSIVDVYDQMFSVDGGSIYDRCKKKLKV